MRAILWNFENTSEIEPWFYEDLRIYFMKDGKIIEMKFYALTKLSIRYTVIPA